jgi:1-acyl-sn-glycerol-3-phosphate acyltransferase
LPGKCRGDEVTTSAGAGVEEQSIGSVTGTDQMKGPWNSYFRGPFAYFRRRFDGPVGNRKTGRVMYTIVHSVVAPMTKVIWRPAVSGLENIPASGPVILASNHLSFADSVVIPVVVPRKVAFLAKSDYFTGTGIKGALSRAWFEGLGMLPVDRDDSKAALDSLDTALGVLGRGEAFGIYPEGTRSRDGRLYRGRTGVAHLALTAGAPVVPVGLSGTDKLQPIDARLPRIVPITVTFGAPIEVAGRYDGVPLGKARREITDEIMRAIAALTGQEEAGVYNERAPDA